MFRFVIIALTTFWVGHSAHALILIEPLAGLNLATVRQKVFRTKSTIPVNGWSYGGRAGFQWRNIQLGLEHVRSNLESGSDRIDDWLDLQQTSGFIGYKFNLFLRLYVGSALNGSGKFENRSLQNIEVSKPTGLKIGVGFTPLPLVDMNVEWRKESFGTVKVDGREDNFFKFKYESWLLSLSVPIDLF